jgi:hypothetical protein
MSDETKGQPKEPKDSHEKETTKSDGEHDKSTPKQDEAGAGVVVPEEFQKKTHELMKSAKDKHHVAHVRSMLNSKEDDMRKEEMKNKPSPASGEFNADAMPSSY